MTCCSSSTFFSAIGFSSFVEGFDDAAAGAADEGIGEADVVVNDEGDAEKAGKEEGDGGRGTEAVVMATGLVVDKSVEGRWQKRLSS